MGAPFVLGVTGCVGAGKSTVSALLAQRGWAVLDTDAVAAEALDEVHEGIERVLPEAFQSGVLDKARVVRAVLENASAREAIEALVVPVVRRRLRAWKQTLMTNGVVDSALLFEKFLDVECDATLVVTCPAEIRRARVQERKTTSARYFDAIEASQWTEDAKCECADGEVSTNCSVEELRSRVQLALALVSPHVTP